MNYRRFVVTAVTVPIRSLLLAIALASVLFLVPANLVSADSGLEVLRADAISEFPDGLRFVFEARSTREVDDVRVRFAVAGQSTTQYNYLALEPGDVIKGEYFYRTGQRDRYVPPGAEFTFFYEVDFKDGTNESTEPRSFLFQDSRYTWSELTKGPITVYYHGPVQKRAQLVADIALATFENMGPVTGADTRAPMRIVIYNNNAEMIGAVSIRSLTSARQLITEGQAFAQHNLVIAQAGADRAAGVISHEVTHILVGRATQNAVGGVPVWLNEGLAEYGNLDPGLSYVRYLEWAIDTDRVVPIVYLDNFPADPNLTIVAYGEARSIVEFMVTTWGEAKIAALLAKFNSGVPFRQALLDVYGFDTQELDSRWRKSVGAKPFEPAPAATPTPVPAATPEPRPTPEPPGVPQPTATATPAPSGGGCTASARGGRAEASAFAIFAIPVALAGIGIARRRL